jgi:hypothetical protein
MDGAVNGAALLKTCRSITEDFAACWETTRHKTSSPCAPIAIELSTSFRDKHFYYYSSLAWLRLLRTHTEKWARHNALPNFQAATFRCVIDSPKRHAQ